MFTKKRAPLKILASICLALPLNAAPVQTTIGSTTLPTKLMTTVKTTAGSTTMIPVGSTMAAANSASYTSAVCKTSQGLNNRPFAKGVGSAVNPYVICNDVQFNNISDKYSNDGVYFTLGASIDFKNKTFVPIGSREKPFRGNFNGTSNSISNVTLVKISLPTTTPMPYTHSGIFTVTSHAKISNVYVINISYPYGIINNKLNVDYSLRGGLVGLAEEGTEISNVAVSGVLGLGLAATGGIVGTLDNSTISNSSSFVNLQVGSSCKEGGGIVGFMTNNAAIYSSIATGVIETPSTNTSPIFNTFSLRYLGGLVGRTSQSYLENTFSMVSINMTTSIRQAGLNTNIAGLIGTVFGETTLINVGFGGSVKIYNLDQNSSLVPLSNRGASPGGLLFGTVSTATGENYFQSDWNNLNSL